MRNLLQYIFKNKEVSVTWYGPVVSSIIMLHITLYEIDIYFWWPLEYISTTQHQALNWLLYNDQVCDYDCFMVT